MNNKKEERIKRIREEYKQRQIRLNKEHVERCNANIIPDHEGCVRTEGPRRQYRGSVDSQGHITWTEI